MTAPLLVDAFTDTSNTALASHVGATGAAWTLHGANLSGDLRVSNANRVRPAVAGAAASVYYASGVPASTDYYVEAVIRCVSTPASGFIGVAGRIATGTNDFIFTIYNFGSGKWELYGSVAGVGAELAGFGTGYAQTLTPGVDYTLRLIMVGSAIVVTVDGVVRQSATGAVSVGRAGVIGYGAWTDSDGAHLDSVSSVDLYALRVIGDSITAGGNASDTAHAWPSLFTPSAGAVRLVNNAVAATELLDQVSDDRSATRNQVYLGAVSPLDVVALLIGYNGMRHNGTNATALAFFVRLLRSALAYLTRGLADIKQGSDAAWTYTGTWSASTACGLGTQYSSTSGDTASISVTGTAITFAVMSHFGLSNGGTCEVKVDGVVQVASLDSSIGVASGFNPGAVGLTRYAPMAWRIDGLSAGAHTVLVTLTSNDVTQICFIVGNGETVTPPVYVAGPLKMNATGYSSNSPYDQGSDAAVALYAASIQSLLVEALADGRVVHQVNVNSYYAIADVDSDNIHPTDAGHQHIADAFTAALAVGATLTRTLGTLTSAAAGTVAVQGALARTLGTLTSAAAGTVAIQGSLARTLADLTCVAAGTVSGSVADVTGALAQTLAPLTSTAAGTVAIQGSLSRTLEGATASAAGTVTAGGLTGQLSRALAAATLVSTGTVTGIGAALPPDSSDIDNALVAKLLADATLRALAPDGAFVDEAGKSLVTGGHATRFVIVSLVDANDEPMFGGTAFEDCLYLVKFVALSTSAANAKAAAARIQALLHFGELTIPGYRTMVMRRQSRVRLTEVDEQDESIRWQHRGGRYQVMVAPAAA